MNKVNTSIRRATLPDGRMADRIVYASVPDSVGFEEEVGQSDVFIVDESEKHGKPKYEVVYINQQNGKITFLGYDPVWRYAAKIAMSAAVMQKTLL